MTDRQTDVKYKVPSACYVHTPYLHASTPNLLYTGGLVKLLTHLEQLVCRPLEAHPLSNQGQNRVGLAMFAMSYVPPL